MLSLPPPISPHRRRRRDIKPANLFFSAGGLLKLGDFGVSKVLCSPGALASTAIGTPYYLSPEVCRCVECFCKAVPGIAVTGRSRGCTNMCTRMCWLRASEYTTARELR